MRVAGACGFFSSRGHGTDRFTDGALGSVDPLCPLDVQRGVVDVLSRTGSHRTIFADGKARVAVQFAKWDLFLAFLPA